MNSWSSDDSTYYDVLEVDANASGKEIYSAYLRAKQTYSPDSPALYSMFSPEEARDLLRLIEEAYATLSNKIKRDQYDEGLARRGLPGFASKIKVVEEPPIVGWAPSSMAQPPSTSNTHELSEDLAFRVKAASTENVLPEGFARTRFGIYELNSRMEEEIQKVSECDGQFLQKIRQYKKISLDQISEATRISKSFLAAIEANAISTLPAEVFVRGFVSQITRTLGVDDRAVTDAYMRYFRNQKRDS